MASCFVGIDGGGTKTRAAVVDATGAVLGEALRGSSNWNNVGQEAAKAAVTESITEALEIAKKDISSVGAIVLGMAGVDRPDDKKIVQDWIAELFGRNLPVDVTNDGVVALASGTGGHKHGIVVISGTGCIALGFYKGAGGEQRRASGWGPLLGDEGSGFAIGQNALVAIARAADGRGPQTALTETILKHLNIDSPMNIIPWVYNSVAYDRVAALSPIVYQTAQANDPIANEIVNRAASELAHSIECVKKSLPFTESEEVPVVFAGGNLTHEGSLLKGKLTEVLKQRIPHVKILLPQVEPVVGAALLAKQLAVN